MASYDGSELAFVSAKSISTPTTMDLALTLDTLLLSVSVSAFLEAITDYIESQVYHIDNKGHYLAWALSYRSGQVYHIDNKGHYLGWA